MKVTTHLRNQATAAVDHAISRGDRNDQIAADVLRVVEAHESCSYCNENGVTA